MVQLLHKYKELTDPVVIEEILELSKALRGIQILHINSTKTGGGVAEILSRMVPLMEELGIGASWQVIEGNADFFECSKMFHNALQGNSHCIPSVSQLANYEKINKENGERLKETIEKADIVFIHDPQPAALIQSFPNRKNRWIWRCHIDLSSPYQEIWNYLRKFIQQYDASVFSLSDFAKPLPHPSFIIPPSIDPLSEKNMNLRENEIKSYIEKFQLHPDYVTALQISRFDRFKDPIGVIHAYRLVKKFHKKLQLVLAGGGATDDPEGIVVLDEVRRAAMGDPDIHVLELPHDPLVVNALQRSAQIILQKSTKEGFGLTITEALWKNKPVIGGNTGGIRLQIVNNYTGYLVDSPEEAALRMRLLLETPILSHSLGERGHAFIKDRFLIMRHLRDYLALIVKESRR